MPGNVYMRSVLLNDATWVRVADAPMVVNAKFIVQAIGIAPTGAAINVRYAGAQQSEWPIEAQVELVGVDIAGFEFQKTSSSVRVLVVGYTR